MTIKEAFERTTGQEAKEVRTYSGFADIVTANRCYTMKLTASGKVKKGSIKRDHEAESICKLSLEGNPLFEVSQQ